MKNDFKRSILIAACVFMAIALAALFALNSHPYSGNKIIYKNKSGGQ